MNSTLALAIAVVESARALEPNESPSAKGLFRLGIPQKALPAALGDLSKSIEAFDRAAANSDDPEAVLGAVVRYVVDRGIDQNALMSHLRRMPSPADAIDLGAVPELVPQPGEVGAPDRVANETVAQANARTRGGDQDLAAKFKPGDGPTDQFAVDYSESGVELGGDDARGLAIVAASLKPRLKHDDGTERRTALAPKPERAEPIESREMSRDLAAQVDELGGRLEKVVAAVGNTPRLRGLMSQFANVKTRMRHDTGVGGEVEYEMTAGIVAALLRVASEVAIAEREMGAEMDDVPMPAMR